MLGLHRSKIMPLMRKLVLALFLAAALAFPKTMSEQLAELEQKIKVHELEQRVTLLKAGTVKEADCPGGSKEWCKKACVRVMRASNALLSRRARRAFT